MDSEHYPIALSAVAGLLVWTLDALVDYWFFVDQGFLQLLITDIPLHKVYLRSIMLAGFFLPRISAAGAKAALFTGLVFYITMTFILRVDLHFVHVWGIEFVLNVVVMFVVSHFYPTRRRFEPIDQGFVDMAQWKHARYLGGVLVVLTIGIYVWWLWV